MIERERVAQALNEDLGWDWPAAPNVPSSESILLDLADTVLPLIEEARLEGQIEGLQELIDNEGRWTYRTWRSEEAGTVVQFRKAIKKHIAKIQKKLEEIRG